MTHRKHYGAGKIEGLPARGDSWVKQAFFGGRQMGKSYFDTTALPVADLTQSRIAATEQNAIVLEIMHNARRPLIPWEVWQMGIDSGSKWLITSVRRSMTVLSDGEGAPLVKLDTLRPGPHGKPSHEWATAEFVTVRQQSQKSDEEVLVTRSGRV